MSSTQRNIDAQYGAKEVLVYDPSVSQVDVLLSGLEAGVQPQAVTSHDALAQIEKALQQPGLKTLHVLGHGAPGEIILGGQRIDEGLQQMGLGKARCQGDRLVQPRDRVAAKAVEIGERRVVEDGGGRCGTREPVGVAI